jgi:hypothetical protein
VVFLHETSFARPWSRYLWVVADILKAFSIKSSAIQHGSERNDAKAFSEPKECRPQKTDLPKTPTALFWF